jgi:anti-anti-sigma factor
MEQAYEVLEVPATDGTLALAVRGRIDIENAQRVLDEIRARLGESPRPVVLDLAAVEYFDSGGGAVLLSLRQQLARTGRTLRIPRSTPAIDGFLELVDDDAVLAPLVESAPRDSGFAPRIGAATLKVLSDSRELLAFTGELILGVRDAVLHPRRVQWQTWRYMERTGVDASPSWRSQFPHGIDHGVSSRGAAHAVRSRRVHCEPGGAVDLRELGPLMTAIIAAGARRVRRRDRHDKCRTKSTRSRL